MCIRDRFCNVPNTHVLQNLDVEYLYEAPLAMEKENLAKTACECLNLDCPEPDLSDWKSMVNDLRHPDKEVRIALVGKYTALHDAYISVVEALKHGGIPEHATIDIKWVDSEELNVDLSLIHISQTEPDPFPYYWQQCGLLLLILYSAQSFHSDL